MIRSHFGSSDHGPTSLSLQPLAKDSGLTSTCQVQERQGSVVRLLWLSTLEMEVQYKFAEAIMHGLATGGASRHVAAAVASSIMRSEKIGYDEEQDLEQIQMTAKLKAVVAAELGEDAGIGDVVRTLRDGNFHELAKAFGQQHQKRNKAAHPAYGLDRRVWVALKAIRNGKDTGENDSPGGGDHANLTDDVQEQVADHAHDNLASVRKKSSDAEQTKDGGDLTNLSDINVSMTDKEKAWAELKHFQQRTLKPNERFRWIFGSCTDHPTVCHGQVLRLGHDKFDKDYRVILDGMTTDQWMSRADCWPDHGVAGILV